MYDLELMDLSPGSNLKLMKAIKTENLTPYLKKYLLLM
jgi:hypothetical protein